MLAFAAAILLASSLHLAGNAQGLRNPLIPGAPNTPAGEAAQPFAPPPTGSGNTPDPVNPGMSGGPQAPPSDVPLPPLSPLDRSTMNSMVMPFLTPPPSTLGSDPGMLPPNNGYNAAAAITNIGTSKPYPNDEAPTTRRGGQTTRDVGLRRTGGSQLTDFGQLLPNMPNIKMQPQFSQDGPRPVTPGQDGATRSSNLSNAQTTQSLYGNRTLFKGPNLRSRMTIAPY